MMVLCLKNLVSIIFLRTNGSLSTQRTESLVVKS